MSITPAVSAREIFIKRHLVNVETILISAIVGVVTSLITAYFTTRFKIREEREKWQREFSLRFLETQESNISLANKMSIQFAIGFVKYRNPEAEEPSKIFLRPYSRTVIGRGVDCEISLPFDRQLSRFHSAFESDGENVFLVHLGATNGTYLNGIRIEERCRLKTDDIVNAGTTEFRFYKMERND